MTATRVDAVVSVMLNDVVDIIVDFCRIWLNFHGVWGCTFNYLCLPLLHTISKDRTAVPYWVLAIAILVTFVGFKL